MTTLYFVLFLLAAICFGVETFRTHAVRINLLALGFLFFSLVPLIQAGQILH